jgi:hypothetical protein
MVITAAHSACPPKIRGRTYIPKLLLSASDRNNFEIPYFIKRKIGREEHFAPSRF